MTWDEIKTRIKTERQRQEMKFPGCTPASKTLSPAMKFMVLGEEVGEVARASLDSDPENLKDELTQVAALAVAWLESLEGP